MMEDLGGLQLVENVWHNVQSVINTAYADLDLEMPGASLSHGKCDTLHEVWGDESFGSFDSLSDVSEELSDVSDELVCKPQQVVINNQSMVELCNCVMREGYPNAWGAKIELNPRWNLELLDSLLVGYYDREVVTWLRYGWPISRPPNWPNPEPTFSNHDTAKQYPTDMDKYIAKQKRIGAIVGPFNHPPFHTRLGVSPLST